MFSHLKYILSFQLEDNVNYFKKGVKEAGFDIKDGDVWEITDESGNVFECSGVNVLELIGDSEKWVLRKFTTTVPTIFALHTAYPNPFNPVTTIQFSVQTHGNTSLQIYDTTGKLVETLVDDFLEPGNHSVQWHASNFSSGIYFYKLTSGNKTTTVRTKQHYIKL